ncbi:hypothetical protein AB4120_14780 [Cupriavidus sp. 2KB_3]|uniref:hypothetical protein n=1 Tax=Cupriavidus sp. 2KB_3 TaxID=3232980 RepID=UPI003F93D37F
MSNAPNDIGQDINPVTGLPLIDDTYIDVGGNPYGTDSHTWQPSYSPGPSYTPLPSSFDPW